MYYAGPGAVVDTATRILAERARAGVAVHFLYDAFGAKDLPLRNLEALRSAGVRVAELRPLRWYALDRASHRSHVRGTIIDGAIGYTGGFGFDDKWLGAGRRPGEWRETNARFTGPAVAQLQTAFIAQWAEATGQLLTGERFLPFDGAPAATAARPADGIEAAVVYSPPLTGSTAAERLFALSIASARSRLYISNAYLVLDANFVQLLVAAARRGVDVRVLTNSAQSDVKMTWLAGRTRYETLLAAGVRIYEYRPTTMDGELTAAAIAAVRRSRRRTHVLLRRQREFLFARGGAEVIRLPLVLGSSSGGGRVDVHTAHRIFYDCCVLHDRLSFVGGCSGRFWVACDPLGTRRICSGGCLDDCCVLRRGAGHQATGLTLASAGLRL